MALNWNLAGPGFNALEVLNAAGQAKQQRRQDYVFDRQVQQDDARVGLGARARAGDVSGARTDALLSGDTEFANALGGLHDDQLGQLQREFDTIGLLHPQLKGLPVEARAQTAIPILKQAGFSDQELANVDWTDQGLDAALRFSATGKAALAQRMKLAEPRVVGDGGALVNGAGQVLYENQRSPKWQFDSESGSWLQEPGTGYTPQGGRAAPQANPGGMVGITLNSESGNRDYAPGGGILTSPAGAQGRMQVMPGTNRDPGFGVRPAQDGGVEERARVGRDYLNAMLQRYGGDPAKAWAAYNAGPGRVDQALQAGDNWLSNLPAETQAYVKRNVSQLGGQGASPSGPGIVNVRPPRRKDAPSGYEWNGNSLRPIVGGPADPNTSTQRNVQSNRTAEANFRKEFDALPEVKNFKSARQQFNALRETALNPNSTAQDDIAVIFQFMKTLDPTSTVREGEFATAQNAVGVPDAIRNAFNKAQNGQRLSPEQRQNMVKTAYRNYQAYRDAYNTTAENYRSYAKDNGINPDRVARTYTPDKPAQSRMSQFKVVKVHQ